jgi:SAM-dependent methyltransferase
VGLSAIRAIDSALAAAGASAPRRMLDMPCGHGRVLRFLRARFPEAAAVACDLDDDGVAYCAERFGAEGVRSSAHLASVELPGDFDLIWCGSLVTHLDAEANAALLGLFARSLSPGGVAVVTTHGQLVAERLRSGESAYQLVATSVPDVVAGYDATGFGYADYPWSPGYGVSISSRAWIGAAAERAGLRVVLFTERGWDDHQDVVALVRT